MYEYELQNAADKLIREMFAVKRGEVVVITGDTCSNREVADAMAASAYSAGAKPVVIWTATPEGVGKSADPMLPVEVLSNALSAADVWIEINRQWLLYSTPFERAMANNGKLRYMCLVEMNADLMIRTIGKVDCTALRAFMLRVTELTKNAKRMRITTPAGTDVDFDIDPGHYCQCDCGDASVPGMHMLTGQINVVPRFGSINGTIVYDGCITPPFGRVPLQPVRMEVRKSRIEKISGGQEAAEFDAYLRSFDDEGMLKLAHVAYGFNPGAKLTGNIVEDERVWGATEWGIGYVSRLDAPPHGQDAKSHCDGICLASSVWLDERRIMENGVVCDDELNALYAR
ncbi:MAG: aminopeptidase [Clostridiaceae bacterium]|nr:aminopeptidase [Eubacteriales bacterium]